MVQRVTLCVQAINLHSFCKRSMYLHSAVAMFPRFLLSLMDSIVSLFRINYGFKNEKSLHHITRDIKYDRLSKIIFYLLCFVLIVILYLCTQPQLPCSTKCKACRIRFLSYKQRIPKFLKKGTLPDIEYDNFCSMENYRTQL